jgi:hypothetical protein
MLFKGFARNTSPPRSVFQHPVEILQLGHWNVSRKRIPHILSGIPLRYQILLSFHNFVQYRITTWLKVMESARKWGPGSKGPLAGLIRARRSLKRDAGAPCNFSLHVERIVAPSRLLLPTEESTMRSLPGVEILESGLVMASAAECLTPDLLGKDFDIIGVPS